MSSTSRSVTIEDLNADEAELYLGGTILVCIFSVVGVIGNLHVLLVYVFRMKQSNHRVFIICLAVLDLITCTVGMPFVIVNFQKPFTFYYTSICKILSFYNFFICISSAGVLIIISVDRYRKICVPLGKQMSQKMAKTMCFVAMGISLLFSWPALVLYGSTPIKTPEPGIIGQECNILDEVKDTFYPVYFNGALLVVSFSSFVVLAVLYSIIGKAIWNHHTFSSKGDDTQTEVTQVKMSDVKPASKAEATFHSGSSDSNEFNNLTEDETEKSTDTVVPETKPQVDSRRRSSSVGQATKYKQQSALQRARSKFDRTKRTTLMLLWITIIFFLSYVPYLVLRIVSYMNPDWYTSMSYAGKVAYNTILWCVFINNMANCIIYGFCDQRFRQEMKRGYSNLCRRH
ncbi:alpha-2 adrenergic receptor-like [Mercenaria mercenaria]|uniref:alpha-2 adrenergic receptor-like n=1 Tax=Mercenaria mercenaria TaxID=6596 RepID=UPI00234FAEDF|nr:alpha-2 adrenergic receptor-like [Mercenaria mercenaria]